MSTHQIPTQLADPGAEFAADADEFYSPELGGYLRTRKATSAIAAAIAGYAIGCELVDTTTGQRYTNTGTTTTAVWTLQGQVASTTGVISLPPTTAKVWDALQTNVVGTPANDDLGLVTGTLGSARPRIQAGDLKAAGATSRKVGYVFSLPSDYKSATALSLRIAAGMVTTVAGVSCTIDAQVFDITGTGAIGTDLVTTAAMTMNSLTVENRVFAVDEAAGLLLLAPGSILQLVVTIACNDAATGTAVTPTIDQVTLTYTRN